MKRAYTPPVNELSGYQTYVSERPAKGIGEQADSSVRHEPGESPRSDRERALPEPTDTTENLTTVIPGAAFNTPGPSEPGSQIHVRTPGTPGEEYGHPSKDNVYPRRTQAGLLPSYGERQRSQKGDLKRYYTKYYTKNKARIKQRAERNYKHVQHSPTFQRQRKLREDPRTADRFKRLDHGGARTFKERDKEKRKGAAAPSVLFYDVQGPGWGTARVDGYEVVYRFEGSDLEHRVPAMWFLDYMAMEPEDLEALLMQLDASLAAPDPVKVAARYLRADFYREVFTPGTNLDPGPGAQDLGRPSQTAPFYRYPDVEHNDRKPGEEMNNVYPTDNNPGSAKVIPEGHGFVNKEAAPDLAARLRKLAPALARAAQAEYDAWEQDASGYDVECGSGGICDRLADAFSTVIGELPDVEVVAGGQDGDDHAYVVALTATEAVAVDIPPRVYETGGGYSRRKKPGVRFAPSDISIDRLRRDDFEDDGRYASSVRVAAKMADILQGLSPEVVARARGIVPKMKRSDVGNLVFLFAVPGSKGESYTVKVKGIPPGGPVKSLTKMDLKVSCTCSFWEFQGPEHWAKVGDYLYGSPRGLATRPDVRDPQGEYRACKHVVAVLALVSQWPTLPTR